jgi:hypothetical protein
MFVRASPIAFTRVIENAGTVPIFFVPSWSAFLLAWGKQALDAA